MPTTDVSGKPRVAYSRCSVFGWQHTPGRRTASRAAPAAPGSWLPLTWRNIDAMVVWMSETPLDPDRSYMVKHMARYVRTDIEEVAWQIDLDNLEQLEERTVLELNDIGLVRFTMHQPLHFDAYKRNRTTGIL